MGPGEDNYSLLENVRTRKLDFGTFEVCGAVQSRKDEIVSRKS